VHLELPQSVGCDQDSLTERAARRSARAGSAHSTLIVTVLLSTRSGNTLRACSL
jgi:hypothetical protein